MLSAIQQKTVQYITDKVTDGYMLGDLKRITNLPVIPSKPGNCNFPIVLYIFSCIEFLGGLVSETPIPDGHGATQKRVWSYMQLTFGPHFQIFQQHEDNFVQIFRHGLSHEFFAKNAGVSRHQNELFGTSAGRKLTLDADRFFEIFYESCCTLKSLVERNEELAVRISERYLELQRRNQEKWSSSSSFSTRTSGATLPRQFTPDSCMTTPSLPSDDNL